MFSGDAFLTDSILPPGPDGDPLPILHDREYRVRAYRLDAGRILILGAVRDQKPPGLYLPNDPEPITVHHMQLSLTISFPELVILEANLHFEQHPRDECPGITAHYGELVGLSIARGFTHKVRELFGGPRGCTHSTALLQAMAPVAVQCFHSMGAAEAALSGEVTSIVDRDRRADQTWRMIVGTCHVWAEDGDAVADAREGVPQPAPVFLRPRLAKLGITDPFATGTEN